MGIQEGRVHLKGEIPNSARGEDCEPFETRIRRQRRIVKMTKLIHILLDAYISKKLIVDIKNMTVANKNYVLVTGFNTRIGYYICKKLARKQKRYHVLMGTRSLQKGTEAAASLVCLKSSAQPIQIDVADDNSISTCVSTIKKQFGHLGALINNAGIDGHAFAKTSMTTREKYYDVLDTNVFGVVSLTTTVSRFSKSRSPAHRFRVI